jgi:hypothetical protein
MIDRAISVDSEARLRDCVAILEAELAATKSRADELPAERDRLREAYCQLELRLFVAKGRPDRYQASSSSQPDLPCSTRSRNSSISAM